MGPNEKRESWIKDGGVSLLPDLNSEPPLPERDLKAVAEDARAELGERLAYSQGRPTFADPSSLPFAEALAAGCHPLAEPRVAAQYEALINAGAAALDHLAATTDWTKEERRRAQHLLTVALSAIRGADATLDGGLPEVAHACVRIGEAGARAGLEHLVARFREGGHVGRTKPSTRLLAAAIKHLGGSPGGAAVKMLLHDLASREDDKPHLEYEGEEFTIWPERQFGYRYRRTGVYEGGWKKGGTLPAPRTINNTVSALSKKMRLPEKS